MNEPAFPQAYDRYGKNLPGMDLLDWFAGQALVGLLTVNAPTRLDDPSPAIAAAAYIMAEAMMAERMKRAGE